MNNFILCFLIFVLGATNQVTGFTSFSQNKPTNHILEKTADLFSGHIESLVFSKKSKLLDKIDNRLASLENAQSECSIKEKQKIQQLKNNLEINVCFNVSDAITDIHDLINNTVSVVLESSKGIVNVVVDYGNCSMEVNIEKQLECMKNLVSSLKDISVEIIMDISNALAGSVSIVLGAIVKVLQCLAKPISLEREFMEIMKTTCAVQEQTFL